MLHYDLKVPMVVMLGISLLASCTSRPTVSITSSLGRHDLRGKTLAVGGFTARDSATYPGQTEEASIVNDAEAALRKRLKRSSVWTTSTAWAAAGPPPMKYSSGVRIILGSKLTPDFIAKARARGMDYMLWIDLSENSVRYLSNQWQSTRTVYPSCSCGKINNTTCRTTSCCSACNSTCSQGRWVTVYHRSESATRFLQARYSLLDTATSKTLWRADVSFSKSRDHYNSSETGYPMAPSVPLPSMESELMKKMSGAAMAKLPR